MAPVSQEYAVVGPEILGIITTLSRHLLVENEKKEGYQVKRNTSKSNARWGYVKTWMFGHVLSSSFARVSLNGKMDRITMKSEMLTNALEVSSSSSSTCASSYNDWDVTYSQLTSSQSQQGKQYAFQMCRMLGSGSYGTVCLCHEESHPNQLYAIKIISKSKLSRDPTSQETQRLLTEKDVLSTIQHPFITKLYCTFETCHNLHYVMEYCPGGDLYYLLEKFEQNRLPESMVQFYAASIALALHYLHQQQILYRDLKPENLLLDAQGFLRLADFGFAKQHVDNQHCQTFCGSADYMAPEIILGQGYGLAADIWSFGCVLYELLTGFPPFYTPNDRALLFRKITRTEPSFPSYFSFEMCDLLSQMLNKNPSERIGCRSKGWIEIFEHPFFRTIDWYQLSIQQVIPPYIPSLKHDRDTTHFEPQFTSQKIHTTVIYQPSSHPSDELFEDFDWCSEEAAFLH